MQDLSWLYILLGCTFGLFGMEWRFGWAGLVNCFFKCLVGYLAGLDIRLGWILGWVG